MDDESKDHTLFKMTRHRAHHNCVTHRKPLRSAKATDPKELLMVLAPSVGSSKGHCKVFESYKAKTGNMEQEKMKCDNVRDDSRDN